MIKSIKIKNIEDIEKVNRIVCKYPFDVWIHGKSGMADAKSILGMFILKLDEPLTMVVPDDAATDKLFKELEDYLHYN
ncbi:hypothetical protein Cpap_2782 [Ruminiclostridium papyrosolvens DSM 2782]|uniref:Phosphotransferase system, phosphocarrier protein HPr n=1 Tax=Ruminiclostridium papyrosolvens DSM 2782 TaxID=588581 RepID=F1TBS1_9FIRM|nr:hypothetical protein [Ruminiclostridium papyrosolvens]EGD48092.1 hypothetical protein Cpap_2782 [Ruminiclostridium papyrosolvens DSM 2782]WES35024.1 HPr family phosphocarrier protein [Ruminiclostridium papyrosolvens DSM 2782]